MILFSDAIIMAVEMLGGDYIYMCHTIFDEYSYVYTKSDLKYYQNLVKLVGK